MVPKQRLILFVSVIVAVTLACQSNINPIPSPIAEPTKPTVRYIPSAKVPEAVNVVEPMLPPGFLEDPNAVCAIHQTNHALSCLNKNGWQVYDSDVPTLIAPCPDGRMYLKIGNQLYLYKNQTFIEAIKPDLMYNAYLYSLACGPGDEFWAWDSTGLYIRHFDGNAWKHYLAREVLGGFLSSANTKIVVAPNGNLWVTTDGGIVRFDGTDWQIFEKGKGLEEATYPRVLILDANGSAWGLIGGRSYSSLGSNPNPHDLADTNKGLPYKLLKYDGTHWTTIPVPDGFDPEFITLDHANKIWLIGMDGPSDSTLTAFYTLFYTFDSQTNDWALQAKEDRFSKRPISDVQFDGQDRLWVATNYGLDFYDGSTWITYRMDNANLYANSADEIIILGNGPKPPAPTPKAPGSVSGKFVDPNSTKSYAGLQVEICLKPETAFVPGVSPCANQAYHALTNMDSDGNFLFTGIPAGNYYLAIQNSSDAWGIMVASSSPNVTGLEFDVYPGEVTQLGQITYSPIEK